MGMQCKECGSELMLAGDDRPYLVCPGGHGKLVWVGCAHRLKPDCGILAILPASLKRRQLFLINGCDGIYCRPLGKHQEINAVYEGKRVSFRRDTDLEKDIWDRQVKAAAKAEKVK